MNQARQLGTSMTMESTLNQFSVKSKSGLIARGSHGCLIFWAQNGLNYIDCEKLQENSDRLNLK